MAKNEATIQSILRLKASELGWKMFRNNVGVMIDSRGIPVRYGLANDSKQVNEKLKSADLIGIRPLLITPDMIGRTVGQFASIECKAEGWKLNPNDAHDLAQIKWQELVLLNGGYAIITTGEL